MPRRTGVVSRETLTSAPLPEATETYTVISHGSVINSTLQTLQEKGFTVEEEIYKCNDGAQIASGIFRLNYGDDPDLSMMFAFANSYDKSMRFKCAVGAYVHINKASIISSDMSSWGRKHTGTADNETAETIQNQIDNAEAYFNQLLADKEKMKETLITKRKFAELLGVLYLELKILSGEQMGIVRKEFNKASFTYTSKADSLWTVYNHILIALAKSHPKTWMEQQKIVHLHLISEFDLAEFDAEETEVEEPAATEEAPAPEAVEATPEAETPFITDEEEDKVMEKILVPIEVKAEEVEEADPVDPNQTDLEEVIAEVETEAKEEVIAEEPVAETAPAAEAVLPGFGPPAVANGGKPEGIITEEIPATAEEVAAVKEVVQPKVPIMEAEPAAGDVEITSEDIFIARADIQDMFPEAEIGDVVHINDVAFELLKLGDMEGVEGYYLRASDTEALEEVMTEIPPVPEDATVIGKEDLNAFFPGVKVGDEVDLEGHAMNVAEERTDDFVLVPVIPMEAAAVLPDPPVKEPEAEVVQVEEEPVEFLSEVDTVDQSDIEAAAEKFDQITEAKTEEPVAEAAAPAIESEDDDATRTVISKELFELYGSLVEYTYVTKGDQYNITLATGETFVLPKDEIDKRAAVV
jgi:hypothetical protein